MVNQLKKVLIIDDDTDLREIFSSTMELDGYKVIQAENGKVALECLQQLDANAYPDCIVLDLMMPVMDGNSFLKALNSPQGERFNHIPVVICSGFGVYGDSAQIFKKLEKPVQLETLFRTVEEAIHIAG